MSEPRERNRSTPPAALSRDPAEARDAAAVADPVPPAPPAADTSPAARPTDPAILEVTIKFDFPVTSATGSISEVVMRRPKVKDRLAVSRNFAAKTMDDQEIIFLANLCMLAPDDIENMYFSDYAKLQKQLDLFTSSAR